MNKQHYQKSIEIDLKDLFWKLLSQWKAIFAAALLMAVLVCGAKHAADVNDYEAALEKEKEASTQTEMSAEERIEAVLGKLSDSDRSAVEYVVSEQKWLNSQKDYMDNSILMSTDPTNQRILKQVYSIKAENGDQLPALMRSYIGFMSGNEMAEAIKPFFGDEKDNKYLGELITLSNQETDNYMLDIEGSSAALSVNVVLTEEADADAIAKAMNGKFAEHSSKMKGEYRHTISLTDSEVVHEYDSTNVSKRSSAFSSINSLEKNLKDAKSNLSDEQQAAAEKILSIESSGEKESEKSSEGKAPRKPGYSKKYAVLGFILGAMLYAVIYVLLAVLRGFVGSAAAAEKYTGTRLLGEVYGKREAHDFGRLLHSSFVDRIYHRGKTDAGAQIAKIASAVDAICDHEGIKVLTLLDFSDAGEGAKKSIADVIGALKGKGIKADITNVRNEVDEKELGKADKVVYVLTEDVKAEHLWNVLNLCVDYDADGIGSIWLGEI